MRISYRLIAFGVYTLYMEGFEENTYRVRKSEAIQGFVKEAKEEVNMLYSFSFEDILQLHNWERI